jgi:hypothetical protein
LNFFSFLYQEIRKKNQIKSNPSTYLDLHTSPRPLSASLPALTFNYIIRTLIMIIVFHPINRQ